VKPYK